MKKTLASLAVLAMTAGSAQAYTLVDNTETGTKIDFSGSLRLMWLSSSDKTTANTATRREHVNHAIANNGSRFGFKATQTMGDDGFYAVGRVEWRMRGDAPSQHNFDHVYPHILYAGIGHKDLGELTFGHQTTITDEVKQTDLPNTLSLSDGLLDFAARKSVQYIYSGIDGLRAGAYYGGKSARGNNGLKLSQERDNEYGAGAVYRLKLADNQSIKFGTGFTRENFRENALNDGYHRTAYAFGTAYTFGATTFGVDLERAVTKNQNGLGNQRTQKEVRTVLFHRLTDQWNAYGMYAHKRNKMNRTAASDTDARTNQFMIGTEHAIAKETLAQYKVSAKTFAEWQTSRTHNYVEGNKTHKTRNNKTVIGLRVYW